MAFGIWTFAPDAKSRPDIILISIDTLAAKHLELYGYERATAPFLTSWARESAVFKNSYSASSYTMPSHMSIFTGLHVVRHKITRFFKDEVTPLDPSITTMAEMLKNAGYETAWFAVHTDDQLKMGRGFERGFDFISRESTQALMTPERLSWLKNRSGKPKFAFFHTYAVHEPYTPPKEFYGKFHDTRLDREPLTKEAFDERLRAKYGPGADDTVARNYFFSHFHVENPAELTRLIAQYDEGVAYADDMFKNLIEQLRTNGLYENALVIFTSDHGEEFMEHGRLMHNSLHHEILHVPLVIHGPGVQASVIERPVQGIDLLPTLRELLEGRLAQQPDGLSFLSDLRGQAPARVHQEIFADINATGSYSAQDAEWKFIDFDPGHVELYRCDLDRFETRDLANENPEVVTRFREKIREHAVSTR